MQLRRMETARLAWTVRPTHTPLMQGSRTHTHAHTHTQERPKNSPLHGPKGRKADLKSAVEEAAALEARVRQGYPLALQVAGTRLLSLSLSHTISHTLTHTHTP